MNSIFLPSSDEMRAFDQHTIQEGTSALELMERAGSAVVDVLLKEFIPSPQGHRVLVMCGPGNNGGDGAVIARLLKGEGCLVTVVVSSSPKYSPQLLSNLRQLDEIFVLGDPVSFGSHISEASFERLLRSSSLIIDCILGNGQTEPPRGWVGTMCQVAAHFLKEQDTPCVSVDVPTGVNASTGEVYEPAIFADATIAIQCLKRGLVQYPGRTYCGIIDFVDIGINTSKEAIFSCFDPKLHYFPYRRPDTHKGNFRKVYVVSGEAGMGGAATLAAHAALRAGASLVTKILPQKTVMDNCWPEIMHIPNGPHSKNSAQRLKKNIAKGSVMVIGPGLGATPPAKEFLLTLLEASKALQLLFVLDADALNLLSHGSKKKRLSLPDAIITPHPGEAARLLGVETKEVQRDRYQSVMDLYAKTKSVTVLKGASSIVFNGTGGTVNMTGNPYLATGGSGDVLSGIIAGLLAQNIGLYEAAQWGVHLHGKAGDKAHRETNGPIIASDITEALPFAIGEILRD